MNYTVVWEGNAYRIIDGGDRLALAPTRLSRPDGHPFYGRNVSVIPPFR